MKICLFLVAIFSAVNAVFAQTAPVSKPYSESGAYSPRAAPQTAAKQKQDAATPRVLTDIQPLTLRVSVLDRNWKPVTGLSKNDFKLFIDGEETEIASVESGNGPINFVFLIDVSVSSVMAVKDLADQVDRVIDRMAPGDRGMAIAFSEKFKIATELTEDREKIKKAVRKAVANPESGTSIYDHIGQLSSSVIPNIPNPAVVVLFTDGVDTTSRKERFDTSLFSAETVNATFYVIYLDTFRFALGTTSQMNRNLLNIPVPIGPKPTNPKQLQADYESGLNFLNDLMTLSGGHTVSTSPAGSNVQISSELPAEVKQQYVITFKPRAGSTLGQRHKVMVRVARPNVSVVARGSYIAQN